MDSKASSSTEKQPEKDFKKDFEKNLNHELESASNEEQQHHDAGPYYPPPPPPPEPNHPPPPFVSFNVPPLPRRAGVYIPYPIAILFLLIFMGETSVIVFYTAVALYRTLPAAGFSVGLTNRCPQGETYGSINVAPNIYLQGQTPAVLTAAMTPVTTTVVSVSMSNVVSTVVSSYVSSVTATSVRVTTQLPVLPSVVTSVVWETTMATPTRSTVTTIELVTMSA